MTALPRQNCCFIIGSIGDATNPDDPVRRHVERVRTELIEPALARACEILNVKLTAVRSDLDRSAGDVWREVLQSILEDRLVIAVLTFERPNVMYELGIAQAAARDVIPLHDTRAARPFDIYHLRTISYALDDDNGAWTLSPLDDLVTAIVETYELAPRTAAFGDPNIAPLNRNRADFHVFERFQNVSYERWSAILNAADARVDFVGTTLFDLTKIDNDHFRLRDDDESSTLPLIDVLASLVLFRGLDVTITFMHEDNPSLGAMLRNRAREHHGRLMQEREDRYLHQVREEIIWSTRRWTEVAAAITAVDPRQYNLETLGGDGASPRTAERPGTFRIVKVREGQIKYRMTLTDKEVISTPIFYRQGRNGTGPALWARLGTSLYEMHRQELGYLHAVNPYDPVADAAMASRDTGQAH